MTPEYLNNSRQKNALRKKWVECIKSNYSTQIKSGEIALITFPAAECQDLALFASEGIIGWEKSETGAYCITKGKVICFEKKQKIFRVLNTRIANAILLNHEIGRYFQQEYNKLMNGQASIFPVEVINLDFDINLSKNDTDIEEIVDLIFKFQNHFKKNFSIFLTFPITESEDEAGFKSKFKNLISSNLRDSRNNDFKKRFEEQYDKISALNYLSFLTVGISKLFVKKSSSYNYEIIKHQFMHYGGGGRRKMISLILDFNYNELKTTTDIYYDNVVKCVDETEIIS